LRRLLEITGQVHTHSTSCFKHLPTHGRSLKNDDKDCHFNLPHEITKETYLDDDGHIHIKYSNGYINGYNDICVTCLCCNMDIKYVGSGMAAMAMVEYVMNYIAKLSLDSSTVFAALCSAIKAVCDNPPIDPVTETIDENEQSRLLLLKTCNAMIGKCELSGQQVTLFLLGIPNHFTNHKFDKLWWSSILKFSCNTLFDYEVDSENDTVKISENLDSEAGVDPNSYILLESVIQQPLDNDPSLPQHVTFVQDMFYHPTELESLSLWGLFESYVRINIPVRKNKISDNNMECNDDNDNSYPNSSSSSEMSDNETESILCTSKVQNPLSPQTCTQSHTCFNG